MLDTFVFHRSFETAIQIFQVEVRENMLHLLCQQYEIFKIKINTNILKQNVFTYKENILQIVMSTVRYLKLKLI